VVKLRTIRPRGHKLGRGRGDVDVEVGGVGGPPCCALAAARTSRRDPSGADCRWPELRAALRRHVRTPPTQLGAPANPEGRKSAESPALSGRCLDFTPCSKASGPGSRSRSFPAVVIVRRVPARLPAAHMARTDARPTAAGSERAARATSAPAPTSQLFVSGRFSPRAPAPAAPPLPARHATHRSKPDGSARESRRSMFPSTCRLR
jgi:hypothetical protein